MKTSSRTVVLLTWLVTAVVCGAQTKSYVFVPEQSTIIQSGGIGGLRWTYQVQGRFLLQVDLEAKFACFVQVEAEFGDGQSLGRTFHMTELRCTDVNESMIRFELHRSSRGFADADIELRLRFEGQSVRLTGGFCEPVIDGFCFELDAVAVESGTGWIYRYSDDFSTDKAKRDSYTHSVFWPNGAFPPGEPYLFYTGCGEQRALVFMDYQGQPAHLGYCFPLGPCRGLRKVKGTFELDVSPSPQTDASPLPPGYLLYTFSPDGHNWSVPQALEAGHHQLDVESVAGASYVLLLGARVKIDNLEVRLESPPATIHVPEDFPTIQQAIDAAADGDIVEVAPGTYRGVGNWDICLRGKAITVRSTAGPEVTIIDCTPTTNGPGSGGKYHRGFYLHENESRNSIVRGFTIRGGLIRGSEIPSDQMRWNLNPAHPIGGGIYCEYSSPTIIDCVIEQCATEYGGGIGCVGGAPVIVNCQIRQCVAGGFGPAESGGRGGGIAILRDANVKMIDCVIADNQGYYNSFGAGVYVRRATAVLKGCEIRSNGPLSSASTYGGGVYCGREGHLELIGCIISRNKGLVGAGILSEDRNPLLNSDSSTVEIPKNRLRLINCVVAQNQLVGPQMPPFPGAGIHSTNSDILVKNSIIWYNEGPQLFITGAPSKSPVIYSDVQGGFQGQGNIDAKPLFASVVGEDYHLQSVSGRYSPELGRWVIDQQHSPCIDAGDPKDPVGHEPVPNGERINMGAYGGTQQASKSRSRVVYHVDGINGNDENDGLSRQTAFATIQKAINAAKDGDVVMVWPAVYEEEVDFAGKAITVQSAAEAAVVLAPRGYAFSFFKGEGADSVLRNFVIRGGEYGIFCNGASPTLTNLTIVDNQFGIAAYGGADPNISNCILWYNENGDLFQCRARYSCFRDADETDGQGNIRKNPLFVDPNGGDYHLQSRYGRYWSEHEVWVLDEQTSPCIDAGDPRLFPRAERMPNGGRLNMGAYGGTPYASMGRWPLPGDINQDGQVNFVDIAIVAESWLEALPWVPYQRQAAEVVGPLDGLVIPAPKGNTQTNGWK